MFDCHTHLHFAAFHNDSKEAIDRALAAGVSVINVGTQRDTSAQAVVVANQYKSGVYATVGLHPVHTTKSFHDEAELGPADAKAMAGEGGWHPNGFTSRGEAFDYDFYRRLASDPKVVALGECGLDYYRPEGNPEEYKALQKEVFLQHVKIAEETGKALMIHCRPSKGTDDAYEDLLSLLLTTNYSPQTAILHFYVGSVAITKKFLDAGFNFEFGGVITFSHDYDQQIALIPLDRILTETDAPYVSPTPHRGKRNESAYLVEVVRRLAEIKGVTFDEMAKITHDNAVRIFKIPA